MISKKKQEVSDILTKKRLSYDLGAEYLKTSDGFEDELTDRLTPKSPEDKNDLAKALRTLLDDNLTKKQKCYIILYYRDGLTVKEIAEKYNTRVLAKLPIDPELASKIDSGKIEAFEGGYLDEAADAIDEILK